MGRFADRFGTRQWRTLFGASLILRLLYPFFTSPLDRLFSDPARHWDNALHFLDPGVMGSSDPYLYQVWLFALQRFADTGALGGFAPTVQLGCGVLCASMPFGWYRALKELLPERQALGGGLIIALTPSLLAIYGYFMNETLLLTLTGFAFWLTLRARRKQTTAAFFGAAALWIAVGFTRVVLWPVALACLVWLVVHPPRRLFKLGGAALMFAALAIPAGLHCRAALGFFSPFGNPYLAAIYRHSGKKVIHLDFGPRGRYEFGSPSFYNPTLYPLSDWLTAREGVVSVRIDTARGRETWLSEDARVSAHPGLSKIRDFGENLLYLALGQPWPAIDSRTLVGALCVWSRWLWPPLWIIVAGAFLRGGFAGRERLLPLCGLSMLVLLAAQRGGIIEGRYRMPIDPILLAAAIVAFARHNQTPGVTR
jgi:hypothetical protein